MTCRDVKQLLTREEREGLALADDSELALHLKSCRRCSEALKVVRLSSTLLRSLREEVGGPDPTFYSRLQARLADAEPSRPDSDLLQALGLARRLIPALAMGVLLLAGVTLSTGESRSSLPVQVRGGTDVYAFSLDEVNLPGMVEEPNRDQMLEFALRQGPNCDAEDGKCEGEGSR